MTIRPYIGIMIIIFSVIIAGCNSISANNYKNKYLEGAWLTTKSDALFIYTKNYMLLIGKFGIAKYKYEIIKRHEILVKAAATGKLKEDSKGFYLDYTPYWLGFIPMDNISIARKISDEEALAFLKEKGISKEQVFNLPIKDAHDGKVSIPDASAPEIFDKLK